MNKKKYKNSLYNVRQINNLRDMVDSSATLFPSANAFLVKDKPRGKYIGITYKKFKKDIESLGTAFVNMGLVGKKIAIIGENSYKWMTSYLAVVNGTGVVVPLDRELPSNEIENLAKRAKIEALIYTNKTKAKVMKIVHNLKGINYLINMDEKEDTKIEEGDVYSWDKIKDKGEVQLDSGDNKFVDTKIDNEAMCALFYTSGTTGKSKGVMLSQKNFASNIIGISKHVKIKKPGIGLSVLPMHHTYELSGHIFIGLYQGCTVAICEGLRYVQQNLVEAKATVLVAVPAIFEAMHTKAWKQAENIGMAKKMRKMMNLATKLNLNNNTKLMRKIFSKLHMALGNHIDLFISGGAAINPKVIEDYQALGIPMMQGYGMTESAPIIAVSKDRYNKPESVGMTCDGTEIKIINQDEQGVGEIICKGPSVMIGYYEDEAGTKEVLKDGWLYTGDYGYFDDEGFLYISGRKKNVIVTKNGKNIFPEEIENLLQETRYIEEVIVYGEIDKRTADAVVTAEIFPDYEAVKGRIGEEYTSENLDKLIKEEIETVNEQINTYKRVKRFKVRDTEFEKTTTRKIKRTNSNMREEDTE